MIKLLLIMLFMHIVDDYYLQGILASMKQKTWWPKQEGYRDLYKNDYKMALMMHSMSWSVMILIPSMVLLNLPSYILLGLFIVNAAIHYYIDDLKANQRKINLIVDQSVHMAQVIATWLIICQWW